jgi:signal transduction histidine kinase
MQGPSIGDRSGDRTVDGLYSDFERRDLARHLAFFYRSPQTQLETAIAFVEHGLRTDNRCLYFVDTNTKATIERALRTAGVDVDARTEAGDLLVRRGTDAYQEADFDPDRLISLLADACRESVAMGYDGLWVAGELSWCFHTDLTYDHVVGFEADFDAACPDLPVTALCQYDLDRFNDDSIAKALWTHEQIIYRRTLCENPYYIPPDEYRAGSEQPLNSRLMLEQMYNLARARKKVEQREQRLAVVNRILRHNIRNDLNVVSGVLDLVIEARGGDSEVERRLTTAIDYVDDVVEIADKARYIERTIGRSTVRRTSLAPFVARAVERVEAMHPDADVTVTGDPETSAVVDTNLDTALVELLSYAVRSQETDRPEVELTVSAHEPQRLQVEIRYSGAPIPTNDRDVLESGTETKLKHCSGLGLWLAKWIVENTHGQLVFPDDDRNRIRLELYHRNG